jgi:aminopeptidase N
MLRKYVGDEAFYEALHIYLMKHAFQSVEIHNLRLAFESVVKEDLNWFFNQWFLAAGHPILDVSYSYKNNDLTIKINQTQDFSIAPTYTLPLKIDYWVKGKKYSQNVEINSKSKDFIFKADSLPDLIMVDTECQLLGVIKKSNKAKQWQFQYQHYEHYPAKIEALEQLKKSNDSSIVIQTSIEALSHSFENIRMQAIENLGDFYKADSALIKGKIALIAQKDKSRKVKIKAIDFLASLHDSVYKEIYLAAMRDSSYALTAQGLSAYLDLKPKDGSTLISELEKDPNPEILEAIAEYYANMPDTSKFEWFIEKLKKEEPENKYMLIQYFGKMSSKASISKQEIALGILEKICRYDTFAGLRFSAYQSMDYFKQTDSLKSIRKDIRAKEKHPRLKEFYSQYE